MLVFRLLYVSLCCSAGTTAVFNLVKRYKQLYISAVVSITIHLTANLKHFEKDLNEWYANHFIIIKFTMPLYLFKATKVLRSTQIHRDQWSLNDC